MYTCLFGGADGFRLELEDHDDLVVVRSQRRGALHDVSPLSSRGFSAMRALTPLFGFPGSGVGVYQAPVAAATELSEALDGDPELQFAGRGLRDPYGSPVVYTENIFVKFHDTLSPARCRELLSSLPLAALREVDYARNAYFVNGAQGIGREVFPLAEELLNRDEVQLCHPELVRERRARGAFAPQWHLQPATIDGVRIDADANVVPAWTTTQGEDVVICILDDGVDIDHEEFSSAGKIVAPRSFVKPRSDDPRPSSGFNHGTACAGVACGDGAFGASGVAPRARLMPLRNISGIGSQDEADAIAWAVDHGADVISCSWGPPCGNWTDPNDPVHDQVVPLPDNTRLAIDHAVSTGRQGRGCVIMWAAGNGNESVDNDGYAAYAHVNAIAACNDSGTRSAYSDVGRAVAFCFPSNDFAVQGRPRPRTPGIWTTDRRGRSGYNPGSTTLGDVKGDYVNSFGGTSSACPGAAGVAALVLSVNPELRWDDVREVLRRSSTRIDDKPGEYDDSGHSRQYGFGRLDAAAAVAMAATPTNPEPSGMSWRPTAAPTASSRTDDIWFHTPDLGWAVNSNGQILRTDDGGASWIEQFHDERLYLRCVGFASASKGWVGTITPAKRLFATDDGGSTWNLVANLPDLAPSAVCGLSVVDGSVVYASGTNYPNRPARMMKTQDGGVTWTAWDMGQHATLLVDTYFKDRDRGWVVGGKAEVENPTRDDVKAVVLFTEDGGRTWTNQLAGMDLPLGEWGWKIQFLDDQVGFVSLESFQRAAILKTNDGGGTWRRLEVDDPQGNANLEGIGFLDQDNGWVGGWGTADFTGGFSSATSDGGATWSDANEIGRFLNRFRFFGDPVTIGYASGLTVYKYSSEPERVAGPREATPPTRFLASNEPVETGRHVRIPVTVPDGARRLVVAVWDRFGEHVLDLVDEEAPASGERTVDWEVDAHEARLGLVGGSYIVRVTVDDTSESRILRVR
jgi:subtilisin family serine protease